MGEKECGAWIQTDLSLSPALLLVSHLIQGQSSFLPEPQSSDLESGITMPPRGGAAVAVRTMPVQFGVAVCWHSGGWHVVIYVCISSAASNSAWHTAASRAGGGLRLQRGQKPRGLTLWPFVMCPLGFCLPGGEGIGLSAGVFQTLVGGSRARNGGREPGEWYNRRASTVLI